jgi:hypothetical protein
MPLRFVPLTVMLPEVVAPVPIITMWEKPPDSLTRYPSVHVAPRPLMLDRT